MQFHQNTRIEKKTKSGNVLKVKEIYSKLLQSLYIFSSGSGCEQSVYILSLACHYISPEEKSNNLYICCILFRFLIKSIPHWDKL